MRGFVVAGTAHQKLLVRYSFMLTASATIFLSKLASQAQVRFPASTADKVQNERHCGRNKKNMNQTARDVKENPATKPGDH